VTVVLIDHLAKNEESRKQGATGTGAKLRTVGGSYLRMTTIEPAVTGRPGSYRLAVNKDRNSGLAQHCEPGKRPVAAVLELSPGPGGGIDWRFRAPDVGDRNPDEHPDPRDMAVFAGLDPAPANLGQTRKAMGVRQDKAQRIWREAKRLQALGTAPCRNCGEPLDPDIYSAGERTHPSC
jgi:hypothetical protein